MDAWNGRVPGAHWAGGRTGGLPQSEYGGCTVQLVEAAASSADGMGRSPLQKLLYSYLQQLRDAPLPTKSSSAFVLLASPAEEGLRIRSRVLSESLLASPAVKGLRMRSRISSGFWS